TGITPASGQVDPSLRDSVWLAVVEGLEVSNLRVSPTDRTDRSRSLTTFHGAARMSSEARDVVAEHPVTGFSENFVPAPQAQQLPAPVHHRRTRTDRPATIALYRETSRARAFSHGTGVYTP